MQAGQQLRLVVGLHHLARMHRKGHDSGMQPFLRGHFAYLIDEVAVSAVYAVETADCGYTGF